MVINHLLTGMILQVGDTFDLPPTLCGKGLAWDSGKLKNVPSLKLTVRPWKWGPRGKGDSYWKPPFLEAMLVLGSVIHVILVVFLLVGGWSLFHSVNIDTHGSAQCLRCCMVLLLALMSYHFVLHFCWHAANCMSTCCIFRHIHGQRWPCDWVGKSKGYPPVN